jgi:hypothetical protein
MSVCLHFCLCYPACKSHLFCAVFYSTAIAACLGLPYFSTLSRKGHDFRKNVIEQKTTFVWKISHFKRNSARYDKYTYVVTWSARYSCQILMKLQSSEPIFEKSSNIKFHANLSSVSRAATRGQTAGWTYRHYAVQSRFSQFWEGA